MQKKKINNERFDEINRLNYSCKFRKLNLINKVRGEEL